MALEQSIPKTNGALKTWLAVGTILVGIGITWGGTQIQIKTLENATAAIVADSQKEKEKLQETRTDVAVLKKSMEFLVMSQGAKTTEMKEMQEQILLELRRINNTKEKP